MKVLFSFIMFITLMSNAQATNYYFSTSLGSDDRAPGQAQNPSTPWKTLGKLNAYFSNLQPGDRVLLKRGEIYYGSIIVNSSGTPGSPIVIGAYGSGSKPVITSLVSLSGWTANQNYTGVYESSANPALSSNVNIVLLNGAEQQLGRYPNSDAANKGYLTINSHSGKASITGNDLPSSLNWTGAELVLRTRRWILDRDAITSQSGNTLFYNASSRYEPNDNYGYFIQNDIKTLDKPGEWYYNPSAKKLSVFLGRNAASSYVIQAATIDNLVSSVGFSDVAFDNIIFKGANLNGFNIKGGSNIKITNCDILFSGFDGVKAANHKNLDIENCTVSNSNNIAIDFGFNGSNNATVRNNTITNTSVFAGMGGNGDGKGMAVLSNGNGSTFEYNTIKNTGWAGISFNGDNVTVKNNFIDSFCLIKDDAGGIYTYTGASNNSKSGRKIIGNIVLYGTGAPEGVNDGKPLGEGIYMDNNSADVEIRDNTVANCSNQGIFIQSSHEITIVNNTIFNCGKKQLSIVEQANHPQVRNCTIANNIFFSAQASQGLSSVKSNADDINLFGKFDNNYYYKPFNNQMQSQPDKMKLYEPNANIVNFNSQVRFEYNASQQNKTINLDGAYTDVANNSYSNSLVLKPYTSIILLKQGGKRRR